MSVMDQQFGGFAAETAPCGSATVLRVYGELDIATVPDLNSELERLTVEAAPVLVVDARDLRFVDSTGLGAFVTFAQQHRGGEVVVIPSTAVRSVVELTALDDQPLHLVESIDDAIAYLEGPASC